MHMLTTETIDIMKTDKNKSRRDFIKKSSLAAAGYDVEIALTTSINTWKSYQEEYKSE